MNAQKLIRLRKFCVFALTWMLMYSFSLVAFSSHLRPSAPIKNLVKYVNPFVGTGKMKMPDYLGGNASANTFPGATVPFGMVQWSPDTINGFTKDRAGSYFYEDDTIRGFSLTHLSGPGCNVFADVPFIPFVGEINVSPVTDPNAYAAKFSHQNEAAAPGSYAVALDSGVKVSLTATPRTGFGRFNYPSSPDSTLLINVGRNASGVSDAEAQIIGDREVSGSVASGGFCGSRNKYKIYFVAEFERPFASFGTWQEAKIKNNSRAVRASKSGAFVTFDTTKNKDVRVKVGVSYVSVENARLNLRAENPRWDFEAVRRQASARWADALRRIEVSGGTTEEKRVFYTALYHALLHPNVFSDVNGEYIGFDDKIHVARGRAQYANYSGWDIYRCEVQLLAWLFPKEASDMAESLVADSQQGGGLPIWAVANDESGAMYGDPSTIIIASMYAFGAKEFDTRAALRAMIRGAVDAETKSKTYPERKGLREYLQYGFIPMDAKDLWGSPSIALEYMIADFSLAQFAKAHDDAKTYREMMRRAQFWTRIFDPQNKYIRARYSDGSWLPGFDFKANVYDRKLPWSPASHKSYVEGNAAQYTWMIPHNMRALFERIGGNDAVVKRLDDFFTELNAGPNRPYFFIGNEPVFAVPWAYDFAGEPYKTQAIVRRAMRELFTDEPGGLPGNDDLGASSAWYVFAATGLYPAIPAVGGFAINSPLFPNIIVRSGKNRQLKIIGEDAAQNAPFVQELRLNQQLYESTWLPFERWTNGATLRFKLGQTPNRKWASKPDAAPPSFNDGMESDAKPAS